MKKITACRKTMLMSLYATVARTKAQVSFKSSKKNKITNSQECISAKFRIDFLSLIKNRMVNRTRLSTLSLVLLERILANTVTTLLRYLRIE